jgi:hypothetical protein
VRAPWKNITISLWSFSVRSRWLFTSNTKRIFARDCKWGGSHSKTSMLSTMTRKVCALTVVCQLIKYSSYNSKSKRHWLNWSKNLLKKCKTTISIKLIPLLLNNFPKNTRQFTTAIWSTTRSMSRSVLRNNVWPRKRKYSFQRGYRISWRTTTWSLC